MDGMNRCWPIALLAAATLSASGCVSSLSERSLLRNTIPAKQVTVQSAQKRDSLAPIDFTRLRQTIPAEHLVGPRDVLGIYVEGVLDEENRLPSVNFVTTAGNVSPGLSPFNSPSVGHPVTVEQNGTVMLPYIDALNVNNMTMGAVTIAVRDAYAKAKVLDPTNTRISVTLIRARTFHVIVMREDTAGTGVINRSVQILSQRGSGDAIELPAYKNDVLHALTATGGLPGEDASNDVLIFRRNASEEWDVPWNVMQQLAKGEMADLVSVDNECGCMINSDNCVNALRIPLKLPCGAALPFTPQDIILNDGDVVYVAPRKRDYFIGAGLLLGGKYILPRDQDTDIFDAIAIANSSALGPAGTNAGSTIFRNGPGNIVAPSRVIVIRQLSSGKQIKIDVDLRVATNDPGERLLILPGDVVMLRYRPGELVANTILNIINIGYSIPNR